jgi:hypothetical protein
MKISEKLRQYEDPKVAPYLDSYDPSTLTRLSWRARYFALSRGTPLTANERKIRSFHNRHQGETAVLIGNGPTLNSVDFDLIKSIPTFGVNAIYLKEKEMGFLPTYYFVEDVFVAEDRAREIADLRGPTKFFGNYLRYAIDDSPNTLWMNVSVSYGNFKNFPLWSSNAGRILYCGGTVSYLAMQLAYYMGFRRLILVGFDHHYVVPDDAEVSGTQIMSTGSDPNHFDNTYFGQGKRWHLPMVERMEVAYRKADKFWRDDKRQIVNATAGGALEVFPRRSLADAINEPYA